MSSSAARRLRRVARRARRGLGLAPDRLTVDAALLVRAGVIDVDWYRVQVPDVPAEPTSVARHYLEHGRVDGLSPNPLFLPKHVQPRTWRTLKTDPLVKAVRTGSLRATHPLFDPRRHLDEHPEAERHPGGPLGHFLATARPDSIVPTCSYIDDELRWGRTHELLVAANERVFDDLARDRSAIAREWDGEVEARWRLSVGAAPAPGGDAPLVTVVMPVRDREEQVGAAIRSVLAQTLTSWELVVVDDGSTDSTPDVVREFAESDGRVVLVRGSGGGVSRARNEALARARGRYVAFLDSDNTWTPDFLRLITAAMAGDDLRIAHAAVEGDRDGEVWYRNAEGGFAELMVDNFIDLNALVVERALLDEAGHFDESLRRMVDWDLLIRLAQVAEPVALPFIGVKYDDDRAKRPRITTTELSSWREVILTKYLIDWDAEAERERVPGRVSIVVPTYEDWRMTVRAVKAVREHTPERDLEIVVLDNGSAPVVWQLLTVLLSGLDDVVLVREPKNTQFALGSNLGFVESTGEHILFLNNDTEVRAGWLDPLLAELAKPDVVAVQPLLLYPDGTVQCAGVVFPERPGLPVHFLADHPPEDALNLGTFATHAVTAATVLMSASDVVKLRGFDPLFTNGWEDIDLFLRAGGEHGRCCRVVTSSAVVHHESKTPGRSLRTAQNRKFFMSRWADRLPSGPEPLWNAAGFEVAHFVPDDTPLDTPADIPLLARPMVVRDRSGKDGRYRWAIKHAAPAGRNGDRWGDVYFAEALARSLRRLGQEVVVDRRDAHQRRSSYLDDITLNLRGLEDYPVQPGALNMMWVISHPDLVTAEEIGRYDRVFAASRSWSAAMSEASGREVLPLLQATDPSLFHPGRRGERPSDDVLFVGSPRGVYRPVVRWSVEGGTAVSVYGPRWEQFIDSSFVKAPGIDNEELGAAYASAGVVLNDHWSDMAAFGFLSNRLFDAVASGAVVVSDRVDGVDDVFGGMVQVAEGAADLARLTGPGRDAFFPRPERRVEIAAKVREDHSFDARAERLLDEAIRLRDRADGRST